MVRDTEQGDSKMIGMVLLRGDWEERYYERPEIFAIGCAGKMVQSERLDDGRYNILLQGVREFAIATEIGETSYRRARVSWRSPASEGLPELLREEVRSVTERFLADRDVELARRLLADASVSDEMLVNFLSYAIDSPPLEKQALLEASSLEDRAGRLCQILEFALGGGGFERGGTVH
jgi:hypothetical protein